MFCFQRRDFMHICCGITHLHKCCHTCHVHYDYPTFILEMDCFLCHIPDNHYELLEHEDCKWIIPGQEDVVWVPADLQIIEKLIARNQA